MKLWIGGELEATVADDFRIARNSVETALNKLIAEINAEDANEWDVIAILRDDEHFPEKIHFSKRGGMDIRLRIPLEQFSNTSPNIQQKLVLEMLLRSLDIIKSYYPNIEALNRVRTIVLGVTNTA